MTMAPVPISPATLELLQIRELALRDRVQEVLASYDPTREEHKLNPDAEEPSEEPPADSVSGLLLEIARFEALYAKPSERPDWFGPIEQLQLLALGSSGPLLDLADEILSEVGGHGTKHFYPCPCDHLQKLLFDHIEPILKDYEDLSRDIKTLRRHVRLGAKRGDPPKRIGVNGLSDGEMPRSPEVNGF